MPFDRFSPLARTHRQTKLKTISQPRKGTPFPRNVDHLQPRAGALSKTEATTEHANDYLPNCPRAKERPRYPDDSRLPTMRKHLCHNMPQASMFMHNYTLKRNKRQNGFVATRNEPAVPNFWASAPTLHRRVRSIQDPFLSPLHQVHRSGRFLQLRVLLYPLMHLTMAFLPYLQIPSKQWLRPIALSLTFPGVRKLVRPSRTTAT